MEAGKEGNLINLDRYPLDCCCSSGGDADDDETRKEKQERWKKGE